MNDVSLNELKRFETGAVRYVSVRSGGAGGEVELSWDLVMGRVTFQEARITN